MVYKLKYYPEILNILIEDLSKASEYKNCQTYSMHDIEEQIYQLTKTYNGGQCTSAFYIQEMSRLQRLEQALLESPLNEFDRLIAKTRLIKDSIENMGQCQFSEKLFESIVSKVWITKETITFELINQLQLMEVRRE